MLFQQKFHQGLASGDITLTFRLWAKPRVKVGSQYRCYPIGILEVDTIDRVVLGEVSDTDARKSGFSDREALAAYLQKAAKTPLTEKSELFRVELHFAGAFPAEPSLAAQDQLSPEELDELAARLAKMDRLSRHGPWTRETLTLIEQHPKMAASKLAAMVSRETRPFKVDVRKLKKLGLTISLGVGYEISPRGRAVLLSTTRTELCKKPRRSARSAAPS